MTLIDKERNEDRAAALVVQALGADRWERRDRGTADGVHDFDIHFEDGSVEPLEVTSNADRHIMQSQARLGEGKDWVAASVRGTWALTVTRTTEDPHGSTQPFDRRKFIEVVVPFVERLDREGFAEFNVALALPTEWHESADFDEIAAQLRALGVHCGRVQARSEKAGIAIGLGWGGFYGGTTLPRALEAVAALEDNRAKLRPYIGAQRRHLFVCITTAASDMAFSALTTMIDGRMDEEVPPPTLPPEITTVWAATPDAGFFITPPGPWTPLGIRGEKANSPAPTRKGEGPGKSGAHA